MMKGLSVEVQANVLLELSLSVDAGNDQLFEGVEHILSRVDR